MLTNDDLERIQTEAKAIQDDREASVEERTAALDLQIGAGKVVIARLKQDLIKNGHGDDVARIMAKARGY